MCEQTSCFYVTRKHARDKGVTQRINIGKQAGQANGQVVRRNCQRVPVAVKSNTVDYVKASTAYDFKLKEYLIQ